MSRKAQAEVFKCLGLSNLEEGQFMEAEQQLKEAVSINEKKVRSSSLLLADSLIKLSKVCEKEGDLEQAAAYAMRALRIREKVLALTLADSLEDNARNYRHLGRNADAIRNEQRATKIREDEEQ